MKVKPSDAYIFNQLFDIRVKHLVEDMQGYRKILLDEILKSTSTTLNADKDFMIDMAEEGFVRGLKLFSDHSIEKDAAYKAIQDQINDILG